MKRIHIFYAAMVALILSGSHRPTDAFRCVHSMPTPSAKPLISSYATPEGTHKSLVVFARFSDEGIADTLAPAFASRIFDPTLPGSLTHFYHTMSNGALTIEGKTLRRRYVSIFPSIYYTAPSGGWGKHGQFALEILEAVDRDKRVDLGQYDNDGPDGIPNSGDDDGYVDFVFINTKSAPENFILRTATGIAHLGFSPDFITDDPAYNSGFIKIRGDSNPRGVGGALQKTRDFGYTVGVMAHEYGHIFGLRDLHDSSYLMEPFLPPHEDSAGIGSWGLMGAGAIGWHGNDGPAPYSPYQLERLGWIGRNNLLVHPRFGAAVRYVTVLTDLSLTMDRPIQGDCGACRTCLSLCPAHALGETPQGYHFERCFAQLKEYRKKVGQYICGICVKACSGRGGMESTGSD